MTRGYRDIFCLFTKWAGKLGITFTSLSMAMYLYTLKFNFHSLRWLLQCSKGWSLGDGCQGQFAILFLVASLPSFSQTIPGCFHNWPKCVQRTALVTKTLPCTQLDSYTCGVSTFSKLLFQLKLSQSFEALVWEVKVPQCFCLARPGNKTKSFQEKNYFLPDLVRAHSSPCTVTATWKMISSSKNFKYFKTWSLGASGTSRPEPP